MFLCTLYTGECNHTHLKPIENVHYILFNLITSFFTDLLHERILRILFGLKKIFVIFIMVKLHTNKNSFFLYKLGEIN